MLIKLNLLHYYSNTFLMAWSRDCKETPKQNFETGRVYLWNLPYITFPHAPFPALLCINAITMEIVKVYCSIHPKVIGILEGVSVCLRMSNHSHTSQDREQSANLSLL